MQFGSAIGLAVALSLASVFPAGAAGFFNFFDWPHYPNWEQSRPHKPHQKRHRQSNSSEKVQREQQALGPFQVIVSIASQEVSVYGQDGFVVRAPISSGMPAHPTPTGVFTVISKARWHESNIYSRAPMPYMERITWSGIALHAGPRPGYPASHGCIRLPQDFAVRLFHMAKIGTRVIVTREPVSPSAISHPNLFAPTNSTDQAGALAVAVAAANGASNTLSANAKPAVSSTKPVSVFVSRKQKKLFARSGANEPLELPITIEKPDLPIGTHIFTAVGLKDDGRTMRWTAVSVPSQYPHHVSRSGKGHSGPQVVQSEDIEAAPSAAEALDRIVWPPEIIEKISPMLKIGSSIVISDNALSDETGADTDFIVLTP